MVFGMKFSLIDDENKVSKKIWRERKVDYLCTPQERKADKFLRVAEWF